MYLLMVSAQAAPYCRSDNTTSVAEDMDWLFRSIPNATESDYHVHVYQLLSPGGSENTHMVLFF